MRNLFLLLALFAVGSGGLPLMCNKEQQPQQAPSEEIEQAASQSDVEGSRLPE